MNAEALRSGAFEPIRKITSAINILLEKMKF